MNESRFDGPTKTNFEESLELLKERNKRFPEKPVPFLIKIKNIIGIILMLAVSFGMLKLSFYLFPNITDFLFDWFSY